MQPKVGVPPPQGDGDSMKELLDAGGGVLGADRQGDGFPEGERMVEIESSARPPNTSATMGMKSTPADRQVAR